MPAMATNDPIDPETGSSAAFVEARNMLRWYTVGLLKLGRNGNAKTVESCGSGTLVRIGDSHYILTAAHVVAALPANGERRMER
jgi:hypothetical protein